jgi:uncharacterized protein (DUF488 family)
MPPTLFTIGYEGNTLDEFLARLLDNKVHTLVDVRANAFSRKPGFSKKALASALEDCAIDYIHLPELGVPSEKRKAVASAEDSQKLMQTYSEELRRNPEGLEKLISILKERERIAIMCFEANQCDCHRGMIAKALIERQNWQSKIEHI